MFATPASDLRRNSFAPKLNVNLAAGRFTLNGSEALERRLRETCQTVLAGIGRIIPENKLAGVALGGGYGRGEGGVLKTPGDDEPYDDLEFYIFVRGNSWLSERRYAAGLHQLSAELSPAAGVEPEFKITSRTKLRRSPPGLFCHDLVMGHQWLLGDDRLLIGCKQHRDARKLPLSEATRLLMNRCSGLLFARERLEGTVFAADDADFVFRNLAQTGLALGDAVLIAFGEYHSSCRERGRRLRQLSPEENIPGLDEVRKRHAAGVQFKLHPHRSSLSREALREEFRALSSLALDVWLWLETRRLACGFQSAADYASCRINKWPATGRWRNRLANAKVFGPRMLWLPGGDRHPRERILNALSLLLWTRSRTADELELNVRRELLLSPRSVAIVRAYRERWRRTS
jgi:hypothetical protein